MRELGMSVEREVAEVVNPYAPPGSELDAALLPPRAADLAGYRPQRFVVLALDVLLGLQVLTHVVNAVLCGTLGLAKVSVEVGQQLVSLSRWPTQGNPPLYFIGMVPFAAFLMRANKNARTFVALADSEQEFGDLPSAPLRRFTPQSMVWWFFVPLLNLVRPYEAVRAVWVCSAPERAGLESVLDGNILKSWWGAWISALIWARVASAFAPMGTNPGTHDVLAAIGSVLGMVACCIALRMVHALERRQALRAAEL
jgi:hypothetical protein